MINTTLGHWGDKKQSTNELKSKLSVAFKEHMLLVYSRAASEGGAPEGFILDMVSNANLPSIFSCLGVYNSCTCIMKSGVKIVWIFMPLLIMVSILLSVLSLYM
ncbi:hypothetical protein ACJX0J_029533 [Zea mays]